MRPAGFVTIVRPVNCFAAGLAAIVAYLIATGTVIPAVLFLFLVVFLVTAAGNVINDYFDIAIDRVNRPDRPIPSGQVTPGAARAWAAILFLSGIIACIPTSALCIAIAIFNAGLLVAYAARLKRTPLFGNIAVSYLSGSMFLFGGALAGIDGILRVLPFAVMTFFAMLARELVKDAEDVDGDRASGASTVPIRYGIRETAFFALACGILGSAASLVPFFRWGPAYLAGILVVDAILLAACVRAIACTSPAMVKESGASTLLKAGMFASLVVFTLSALYL